VIYIYIHTHIHIYRERERERERESDGERGETDSEQYERKQLRDLIICSEFFSRRSIKYKE